VESIPLIWLFIPFLPARPLVPIRSRGRGFLPLIRRVCFDRWGKKMAGREIRVIMSLFTVASISESPRRGLYMYWLFPDTRIVTDKRSRGLYTLREMRAFEHPLDFVYPVFVGFRYLRRSLWHPGSGAWNASQKSRRGWFRTESQWQSFLSGKVSSKWVDNTPFCGE